MTACPSCGATARSRVVLTTHSPEGDIIRRRHCAACGWRYYTRQTPEVALPNSAIQWLGRNGRRGIQLRPAEAA